MSKIRSDLYAFQYDIFQRYSFLQQLMSDCFPSSHAERLSVLDVGCGASRLSSSFLGETVKITRADVSDFGEDDIIVLDPDAPLPFEDASFDVVMALEVLEHIPAHARAIFLAECQRVARYGVVICCPVADGGAADAEKVLNNTVRALADKDEAFLIEHATLGLPTLRQVKSALSQPTWNVTSVSNAPLDHWLLFSVIDLIYAYDFGDSVQKDEFNAKINATAPFLYRKGRHYREFFVATRDIATTARVQSAINRTNEAASEYAVDDMLLGFASALPTFRQDMQLVRDRVLQPLIDDLRQRANVQDAVAHELRIVNNEGINFQLESRELRQALDEAIKAVEALHVEKARIEQENIQLQSNAAATAAEVKASGDLYSVKDSEYAAKDSEYAAKDAELAHVSQALADLHQWMRRNPIVVVARVLRRIRRAAVGNVTGTPDGNSDVLMALRHSFPGRAIWAIARKSSRVRHIAEQLRPRPVTAPAVVVVEAQSGDHAVTVKSDFYTPPVGLLPWFDPLNIEVSRDLATRPHLNVLVPGLAMKHMSGGPNTAISIAYRLAALGVPVRFISTNAAIDADATPFWAHAQALAGIPKPLRNVELVDAFDRTKALKIGENDLFMATAWWTAQMAKYAIRHTRHQTFIYLIQDYEPILHPASTQYALAEETYGLDFVPLVNTSLLSEFLISHGVGRFSDSAFAHRTLAFEPAVDKKHFYPEGHSTGRPAKRRLLFYARPTNGLRNLYELGVAALQKLLADGVVSAADWEFVGMGEKFDAVPLGSGAALTPTPWLGFEGYAQQMRESDVLLSLMLSPHPSYPPLEMAACGKPVVTTCYANKTAKRLAGISENIIAVEATVEAIADGLAHAITRVTNGIGVNDGKLSLPQTWDESLESVIPQLKNAVLELMGAPASPAAHNDMAYPPRVAGCDRWPANSYEVVRYAQTGDRATQYQDPEPELISFLTPVWNTDPEYVRALAESVFAQDCGTAFEWILLDNAPTRRDTNDLLDELAAHPCVRLIRVEKNLGILGGLRYCLEKAKNQYVVPLDADDLISSDCVRVLTSSLKAAGYPALAYTDEDKCDDSSYRDPYYKPDWDPVLFAHSCYISHLCAIDRELALELGAYTDPEPEGSHDWDTFMRFWLSGRKPYHVPEVLYTWRIHAQSTAGNIHSKSYIYSSQSHVISKIVKASAHPDWYSVELSPLFDGTPDWRIVRTPVAPKPDIPTITLGRHSQTNPHSTSSLGPLKELLREIERIRSPLVHLQSIDVTIEDQSWAQDAQMLFELFPDTGVVGGRLKLGHEIVSADIYFGFGNGFDSPNAGRNLDDSGYFCQMWKPHSVSAVSVEHCVIKTILLREVLQALLGTDVSLDHLGVWIGAAAEAQQHRVIFSPFFLAEAAYRPTPLRQAELLAFRKAYPKQVIEYTYLSRRLDLTVGRAFLGTSRSARERQEAEQGKALQLSWDEVFQSDLISRRLNASQSTRPAKFALLTLLYSRSPAEFFETTAESVLAQSLPLTEWIVLENGPIPGDVSEILDSLAAKDSRIRRFKTEALGIVGGLRFCLEQATADFIIPMDADDLLTVDALERMAEALDDPSKPSFVFSDEDIHYGDRLDNPLLRGEFDPVLNRADSYVWHACAFRRKRALALDVYGDKGAEYCHDWDSITRFSDAGDKIAHIPFVLYHWRAHANSSSNSGTVNVGSINSVKHVLSRSISQQANPELYIVDVYPFDRGVEQYGIARSPQAPMPLAVVEYGIVGAPKPAISDPSAPFSSFVRLRRDIDVADAALQIGMLPESHMLWIDARYRVTEASAWEAMRLFEMHSDVAIVSGRILSESGVVLAACEPQTLLWSGSGMRRLEPGPFAMALKPQTANNVPIEFFFCRKDVLLSVLEMGAPISNLGNELVAKARGRGMRVAYSPLIEAS